MNNSNVSKADRKVMAEFEAEMEALDLKEYALDYIDTFTNAEIAQMVREKILTIEEVEAGLRRRV